MIMFIYSIREYDSRRVGVSGGVGVEGSGGVGVGKWRSGGGKWRSGSREVEGGEVEEWEEWGWGSGGVGVGKWRSGGREVEEWG